MSQNQSPSQQSDLFDVVVEVRNFQGNLIFLYYPKAGVFEFKRNKVYGQISLSSLLDRGVDAIRDQQGDAPFRIQLPEAKKAT